MESIITSNTSFSSLIFCGVFGVSTVNNTENITEETPNTTTENKVTENLLKASADGNVARVSLVTMKERFKLRAKKLDVATTGEAKLSRAQRIG